MPKLNGCHNGPNPVDALLVQKGYLFANEAYRRIPRWEVLPNANSKTCQYSRNTPDEGCIGCERHALTGSR